VEHVPDFHQTNAGKNNNTNTKVVNFQTENAFIKAFTLVYFSPSCGYMHDRE